MATTQHFARPRPAPKDAPVGVIFDRPLVCRVCGLPIERVKAHVTFAFRHVDKPAERP